MRLKTLESAPVLEAAAGRFKSTRFAGVDPDRYGQQAIPTELSKREISKPTRKERAAFDADKPAWIDEELAPIGILRGYSSTREVDSYGTIIPPSAWEKHITKFLEFPIYLYGHDYWSMPIGVVTRLELDDYGLWTERYIFGTQAGEEAWLLIQAGALRADSVGFILHDWKWPDEDGPIFYTETQLIEDSLVMLPANRAAKIAEIESGRSRQETVSNDVERDWADVEREIRLDAVADEELREKYRDHEIKIRSLSTVPAGWPADRARQARTNTQRRSVTMSADKLTLERVNEEIDEALAPLKSDLEGATAKAGDLKKEIEKLARAQAETKDSLADQARQTAADIQEKLDKIIPDFIRITDELAEKIAKIERQSVPGGDLKKSPFSTRQLAYMPIDRVRAAHDKALTGQVEHFQKKTDELVMLDLLLEGVSEKFKGSYHREDRDARIRGLKMFDEWDNLRRAMDSTTAGAGDEWVPEEMSPRIEMLIRQRLRISGQFRVIPMPSNPYTAPVLATETEAKLLPETTNAVDPGDTTNEETPTTAKVSWSAKKARGRIQISEEFDEDAVRPVLGLMEELVVRSIARARDNAGLNGDDSGTHMDSDVTASTEFRKAFKGLRKLTLAAAKKDFTDSAYGTSTTQILNALRDARASMGKYGEWSDDLAVFSSLKVILSKMLAVDQVQTLEKLGPQAVIRTGQLAALDGMAVIPSEFSRDDLNASGVYDGVTTNTSIATIANTMSWVWGERGPVQVGSEFYLLHQVFQIVAWHRFDFEPLYNAATEKMTAQVVNITFA